MNITDQIHQELMDGLKTNLDYEGLREKWAGSKGPFYNALQRVFADSGAELAAIHSEVESARRQAAAAQQQVEALARQQKKADQGVEAARKEERSTKERTVNLRKEADKLEREIRAKRELVNKVQALEEIGFHSKHLHQLHDTVVDIGTRRGLKPKEALAAYFSDLADYDALVGFQRERKRLETIIKTLKLEAQKCEAQKDSLERDCKDKKDVVHALESLLKQGAKPEHILAWNKAVEAAGGVEELTRDLATYKSLKEALAAGRKVVNALSMQKQEFAGEVNALQARKAEIQGAVRAMSAAGMAEITAAKSAALAEIKAMMAGLAIEVKQAAEVKVEAAKLENELYYARFLKPDDEALRAAPKEVPELFMRKVVAYCRLRVGFAKAPCPAYIRGRIYPFGVIGEITLADLLEWGLEALTEAKIKDWLRVPRYFPVKQTAGPASAT
jgi:chromosome segregation ATPase